MLYLHIAKTTPAMTISEIEKVLLGQHDELEALEGEVLIHRPIKGNSTCALLTGMLLFQPRLRQGY